MRRSKNTAMLIILIISGALIGAILGEFLNAYNILGFLAFGTDVGFTTPISINLYVIQLSFSFLLRWNIGAVIGTLISIIYYARM